MMTANLQGTKLMVVDFIWFGNDLRHSAVIEQRRNALNRCNNEDFGCQNAKISLGWATKETPPLMATTKSQGTEQVEAMFPHPVIDQR